MKKIITLFIVLMLMVGFSNALAQESVRHVINTKGRLAEIAAGSVRVVGKGTYSDILLYVDENTHIVNVDSGDSVDFSSLQKGERVTAYYGPAVNKGVPPQGDAMALVVGNLSSHITGIYTQVGRVEKRSENSLQFLNTNGDMVITISSNEFPSLNAIKEGSELLVWYHTVTMNMPMQARAVKVRLLPGQNNVHVDAGVIILNGKKFVLGKGDRIVVKDNKVMLPLRTIAESLGYSVIWEPGQCNIELRDSSDTVITLKICSSCYEKGGEEINLGCKPEIVDGKIMVPLEFFTKVLDLHMELGNSQL